LPVWYNPHLQGAATQLAGGKKGIGNPVPLEDCHSLAEQKGTDQEARSGNRGKKRKSNLSPQQQRKGRGGGFAKGKASEMSARMGGKSLLVAKKHRDKKGRSNMPKGCSCKAKTSGKRRRKNGPSLGGARKESLGGGGMNPFFKEETEQPHWQGRGREDWRRRGRSDCGRPGAGLRAGLKREASSLEGGGQRNWWGKQSLWENKRMTTSSTTRR